jgi:hypothetical protein
LLRSKYSIFLRFEVEMSIYSTKLTSAGPYFGSRQKEKPRGKLMTISKYGSIAVAASLAAVLAMPTVTVAQEEEAEDTGPNFIMIRTVKVSTGANAEWVALQQQLVAAEKEAGTDHRWVYQQVRGSLETYHIVSAHADRAGFDDDDGLASLGDAAADWGAAISKTISSRSLREARIHKDLTIPRDEETERNLMVVRRTTLKQGQGRVYHAWVADRLLPALIAGGATGVSFNHTSQGGSSAMCTMTAEVANWAEFDGDGALSHLSPGERAGLFANWDDMVESSEVLVGAYRADLSY